LYNVVPALFEFIEDLTNWYIRLNRSRFWAEGDSLDERWADKSAAYQTLYRTLHDLTLAMAPFAPFLAEHVYQALLPYAPVNAKLPTSVHLCRFPQPQAQLIQPSLEAAVTRMQNIILLGRQKRNQVKIKTKTPLRRLTIVHQDKAMLDEIARLEAYIKGELNVKTLEYSQDENRYIKLFAKPNAPVLGKRLGKDFGRYRGLIEKLDAAALNALQEKGALTVEGVEFGVDDILVFREPKPGTEALSNRFISIDMDPTLDPALIQEGLAREVINRIQKTRKDIGLNVADRIAIAYTADRELAEAIEKHAEHIKRETLCTALTVAAKPGAATFEVDDLALGLTIEKT
jgi:isoleucyl-tRNA synthetase